MQERTGKKKPLYKNENTIWGWGAGSADKSFVTQA